MNKIIGIAVSMLFGGPLMAFAQNAEPVKAAAPEAPVVVGEKATAGWDETTVKAAKTKEHEKILKAGKVVTVTGEVVDASCYLQLGRQGQTHIDCGMKCILNGMPIGLVTSKKELYLIMPEQHDARRDGQVNLRGKFAVLVGKQATVTGMLSRQEGYKALYVKADPVPQEKK